VTYLDVTYISAITGNALFSRRLPWWRPTPPRSRLPLGAPPRGLPHRLGPTPVLSYRRMKAQRVVWSSSSSLRCPGCSTVRNILASPRPVAHHRAQVRRDPLAADQQPAVGDVRSEPEYIWVEENKVPTTITTLIRGKGAIIAAPEIVANTGPPPGGDKISPRQGNRYPADTPAPKALPIRGRGQRAVGPGRRPRAR